MRTALCDMFGIEYPIFAFTHCRDVVAAVSRAGGLGVLGAVGFSPEQLEIELDWIDQHVDGKPYGVDTVMPQKSVAVEGADASEMLAQIRSMIDANHWRYVDELMERFDLPELPAGDGPHGVLGWTDDVAQRHVDIALAHPIALIANALGSPPKDVIDRAHEHGVKVAALAGKAVHAQRHVNNGVDIVVNYAESEAKANSVAEDMIKLGVRAIALRADVTDPTAVQRMVDETKAAFGRVDILVLNAAATSFRPLLDAERRHLERTFAISVYGSLQCVQRAVALMPESGGRIVAVSGADTRTWIPGHGLLGAAKAALENMVSYLGCELGARGVTVVGVSPGWMDGDSIQQMLGPFYEAAMRTERDTHPMRVTVSPEEVAEVVSLLCGDSARWFNGTTIDADGAGVFAFCGRYSTVGAKLSMARGKMTEPPAGAAPAVPL